MKYDMVMPKLGESITEGTVIKWLKTIGERIEKDETILEISTDKVDSEIPAAHSGVLIDILAEEGDVIEVGKVIAVIEDEAEEASGSESESSGAVDVALVNTEVVKDAEQAVLPQKVKIAADSKRFYSPLVLNIAAQNDISLSDMDTISGSGIDGRVRKQDLLKYIDEHNGVVPNRVNSTVGVEVIPMDNMRKSIAKHMIQSTQTSAHVNLYTEVDMNNIYKIRERENSKLRKNKGYGVSYMPFITEAAVMALKKFPLLNASIEDDNILLKKFYNIGIAVAVGDGLIVPNIYDADKYSLAELARLINDLSFRARNKKLKPDEVLNGTFSISNFGVYGTTIGFPIINQPQSAILGVGALKKRAVVIDDAIAIRPIIYLALTIDHRLIDGAMGAQFLEYIKDILENYNPALEL
jgi:2-oxoglutarate dehydrogenase E2 component (dihydrolipoamide succinyltransferase)